MPAHRSYEKTKKRVKVIGGTVAVLSLLGFGAPVVAGKLVTSPDIKDGAVHSPDIADNGVRSPDIRDGGVHKRDLSPGLKNTLDSLATRLDDLEGAEPDSKVLRVKDGDDVDFWAHPEDGDLDTYTPKSFYQESLKNGVGDFGVNVVLLVDTNGDGKVPTAKRFVDWQGDKANYSLNGDRAVQMDAAPQSQPFVDPSAVNQWYVSNADGTDWDATVPYGPLSNVQAEVDGKVLRVIYLIGGNGASWGNDAIRVTPLD